MKALTQWKTIAPILTITRLEISRALFAGEDIDWASIFGVGVNHAFGSENGRLRPMTKAWTVTHGEGEEIPGVLDGVRSLQEDHPDAWELFNLAGLPGSDEPLGDEAANAPQSFERRPQHRLGSDYARDGQALRETLDDRGELSKLRDALVIEDMHAVGDELAEVLALLRSAPYFFREPGHGNAFHSCLSTRRALVDLRYLQLQDRNMPLEQHDVTDLVSLATAFVYADVVVTEKRWAHFARRLKIEEMHGTRVVSRIEDVAAMRAS